MPDAEVKVSLTEEAARMLMHRSGWYSSKLHLSLIMMAVITIVFWRMGFPPERFETYCIAMGVSAGIYSGTRLGESFAAQRAVPTGPPGGAP